MIFSLAGRRTTWLAERTTTFLHIQMTEYYSKLKDGEDYRLWSTPVHVVALLHIIHKSVMVYNTTRNGQFAGEKKEERRKTKSGGLIAQSGGPHERKVR